MRTTCSRRCCRTRPIRRVWCPSTPCRWTACSGSISSGCWPSTMATFPPRPGHWACTAGPFSANCRSAPCVADQTLSCDKKKKPRPEPGFFMVRSMRISVLTDTADDPGLVVPIGTFQPPALVEVFALVGGELSVHAGEADGGDGPAFALLDAFQTCFQLLDEAIAAGRIGTAFGQHLLQQGRVQVLGHARHIVVTPVALQGVEVLLRAFQEAVGVKPGGCVHGDRGCCRLGGGALARPDRLLLRSRNRATRRVRLALHDRGAAAGEQLEQHEGQQAEDQDVEQLQALEAVTEQHGCQQTAGGDTGQRTQPAAGPGSGGRIRLLVARRGLLLRSLLALGRLALVHGGGAEALAATQATGFGIGDGQTDHEEYGKEG